MHSNKTKSFRNVTTGLTFLVIAAIFVPVAEAQAVREKQSSRRSSRSLTKEDTALLSLFKPLASSASDSTVKIQSGTRQIAVGMIVDENGLILTKASEMRGSIRCRLPDGEIKPATVEAIDVENDLALLKIDATGLAVAPLNPVSSPVRGAWLASPTDQHGSLTVGVVGVEERKIPPSRAFIGVEMRDENDEGGVLITRVIDNTPAKSARLQSGDVIQKLDEFIIGTRSDLVEAIGKYTPGSEITLTINRDKKEVVVRLTLGDAKNTSPMNSRSRTQNSMGSRLSRRGTNFSRAFQHDMALEAKEIGGPVVNLDGEIVGINVARSGRVSSLALPVDLVLSAIERLKSGDYSPVKVNAKRIDSTASELAELEKRFKENSKSIVDSEQGYDSDAAKLEELERMKREITERIKEVYDQRLATAREKRLLKSRNGEVERSIEKLEKQLEALRAGTRPGY